MPGLPSEELGSLSNNGAIGFGELHVSLSAAVVSKSAHVPAMLTDHVAPTHDLSKPK